MPNCCGGTRRRNSQRGGLKTDMKPRVFPILSAVSLALCLGTTVFWVRSYWHMDALEWLDADGRAQRTVSSRGGWLVYSRWPRTPASERPEFTDLNFDLRYGIRPPRAPVAWTRNSIHIRHPLFAMLAARGVCVVAETARWPGSSSRTSQVRFGISHWITPPQPLRSSSSRSSCRLSSAAAIAHDL